jgi:rubrerythrin
MEEIMTVVEALKLALEKERNSIKLYRDLSQKHSGIKDLFDFLITEEQKHEKLITEKIVAVTKY